MTNLFTLNVPSSPDDTSKGGRIICTSPQSQVYVLTFSAEPDNRLTSAFCATFMLALDILEQRHKPGLVITTSGISKFYSNGLDLEHCKKVGFAAYLTRSMFPLMHRILSFPWPTLALINGHCFAGGLLISMCHDYRLQSSYRGYLCMNEVLFGMTMDTPMLSVLREKVPDARTYRTMVLEGHRFNAEEALASGIVDGLVGGEGVSGEQLVKEAVSWATGKELQKKADAGVYGAMKEDMYRETLGFLAQHERNVGWRAEVNTWNSLRKDAGLKNVEAWEKASGSSKGSKL